QPAWGVEEIKDGSFESSACPFATLCLHDNWLAQRAQQGYTGPICVTGGGLCGNFGPSVAIFPRTGSHWVQFGGEDIGPVSYSVSQAVNIPAAPATLRFYLSERDDNCCGSELSVSIDSETVFTETDHEAPNYRQVTVDVSSLAGAARTLMFAMRTTSVPR